MHPVPDMPRVFAGLLPFSPFPLWRALALMGALMLVGCGGSSTPAASAIDPAEGADWNQMEWDRGQWA